MNPHTFRRLATGLLTLTVLITVPSLRSAASSSNASAAPSTTAPSTAAPLTVAPLTAGAAAAPAAAPASDSSAANSAAPAAAGPSADDAAASSASSPRDKDEDASWDEHGASRHRRRHQIDRSNSVINLGHDSTLKEGDRADSVVSVFGSSTSYGEAADVVSILGDTRVTGEISDSAVAVLGSVSVDGKVDGDVVAVLGDVNLGPHAEIDGSAVSVGGTLHRDPGAIVHGDTENVLPGTFYRFDGLRAWTRNCLLYGRPLALVADVGWAWGIALGVLVLYMLLAVLFREGLFRCVSTFETHPGHCLLAALIAVLATPVLIVLLCATVIGIAAVPFVVIGLVCAGLFGRAALLAWIGRRIAGARGSSLATHPALLVLIGGAVVLLLYLVPVIGFLVFQLLGFLGLGTVLYAAILSFRGREAARAPAAAAAPTAGPVPSSAPSAASPAPAASQPFTASPPSVASPPLAAPQSSATPPPSAPPPAPTSAGEPSAAPASASASSSTASAAATPRGPSATAAAPASGLGATLPRAGFMRRMGALLIDVVLVGIVLEILNHHLVHRMELTVLAAYGAVMWKMRGSTVGGLVLDLKVVRIDGRELDWTTAIVRALGCFLSVAIVGLGFFWIAFDPESQAWHDKIAGTLVLRVAKTRPLV